MGVMRGAWVWVFAYGVAMGGMARGQDVPKEAREELARHAGVWRAETMVYEGEESDPEIAGSIERVVDGDRVVWRRDGKSFSASKIVVDGSAEPATIDVIPEGGPAQDKRVLGIYKREGDRLTICMAAPDAERPKEFKAEKGSKRNLMVFVRMDTGKK